MANTLVVGMVALAVALIAGIFILEVNWDSSTSNFFSSYGQRLSSWMVDFWFCFRFISVLLFKKYIFWWVYFWFCSVSVSVYGIGSVWGLDAAIHVAVCFVLGLFLLILCFLFLFLLGSVLGLFFWFVFFLLFLFSFFGTRFWSVFGSGLVLV